MKPECLRFPVSRKHRLLPRIIWISFLASLCATRSLSGATETDHPQVPQAIIPLYQLDRPFQLTGLAATGGKKLPVALHIHAGIDRETIFVNILQLANRIVARPQAPLRLTDLLLPPSPPPRTKDDIIEFPLPAVERPTSMMLVFLQKKPDGKRNVSLGYIPVTVYPDVPLGKHAAPLADAIRKHQDDNPAAPSALTLVGGSSELRYLRDFLIACGIPFVDGPEDIDDAIRTGDSQETLHVGGIPDGTPLEKFPAPLAGRWIFFIAGEHFYHDRLAGVHSVTTPEAVVTKVTHPLLPYLAGDPGAREAVLKLITDAVTPVLSTGSILHNSP
ncbi:hypothetical protein OPIT5_13870 [Opitutaceae bacterium TAV5]|nr:hypothetical protein OPIT5_13870 [Opitutaceae bacterium TAV5]